MALTLKACIREVCDGLDFSDTTREYNVDTNAGGWGGPNVITGPSDFDTLTLSFWDAALDPNTDAPSAVINLLTNVPAQSADEDYDWATFTFAQLGVTTITDGIAYFEYVGVKDGDTYRANFQALLVKNLRELIEPKAAKFRPGSPTKAGCIPITRIVTAFMIVNCGWACDPSQAEDIIKWIKSNLNATCC